MSAERDAGLEALQRGDTATAIAQLESATQQAPDDYQAHVYLGASYGQAGRHDDAVRVLTRAVQLDPANAQARYNLGIALERAGWREQAVQALQQALQLQPGYPKAQEALQMLQGPSATPAEPPVAPPYPQPAQPPVPSASYPPSIAAPPPTAGSGRPLATQPLANAPMPASMPSPGYSAPMGYTTQCCVCGTVLLPGAYSCPRCGAPVGTIVDPNNPVPSYIPVGGAMPFMNTSGQRSMVPVELQGGWNWGAAFLAFFWGMAHQIWWVVGVSLGLIAFWVFNYVLGLSPNTRDIAAILFLLQFIAFLTLIICLGVRGNELAWKYRHWESIENCQRVQRIWAYWVLGLFLFGVVLFFVLFWISLSAISSFQR